jgi:hypothetical protein
MKYRKKPVVIEALIWDGSLACYDTIEDWAGPEKLHLFTDRGGNLVLEIKTLEGDMRANEGDFIIRGVKGEFYPCKPDIFEATYECVE